MGNIKKFKSNNKEVAMKVLTFKEWQRQNGKKRFWVVLLTGPIISYFIDKKNYKKYLNEIENKGGY